MFESLLPIENFLSRLLRRALKSLLDIRFLALTETEDYLFDSFAVLLKHGKQAKFGCVAPETADLGYCASKDIYYHGVKLHNLVIRRSKTLPMPFH